MIDENHNPWTTLNTREVYDNKWITLTHSEVLTPTGSAGIYSKLHMKNYAIGIIPVDEDGNTWLVGQYRYPLNAYSWEIPEGGGLIGQDILTSAKRELKEEAGLIANKWTQIALTHTSNSVTDETAYLFLAQELTTTEAEPDETEELQLKKLPLTQAFELAMNGGITDAMSLVALLKLKVMLQEGHLKI